MMTYAEQRILQAYDHDSTASIDLEAANPDDMPTFPGVSVRRLTNTPTMGFPIYRYSGRIDDLAAWLSYAYEDGDPDGGWWVLLARELYPDGVPTVPAPASPDAAVHGWCIECGREIEQTDDGRWIDAHTAPAASVVFCYDDADVIETDAPSDTRHSPS